MTRDSAASRYGLRELLLAIAVALVGVPFGWLLHEVASKGSLTRFDERAAQRLHARLVHNNAADTVLKVVTFTGTSIFLTALIGVSVVWLWRRRARKLVAFLLVVSLGGAAVNTAVKIGVGRPRPKFAEPIATAAGKSFPSGHSMNSLICYGAVLLVFLPLITRRWRPAAIIATALWVLAIGFSRVALGVHFVSDVVGGFVLGAAWLIGSVAAFEVWREERGRPRTRPLQSGVEPEEAEEAAG